jgi:hypothetical protein
VADPTPKRYELSKAEQELLEQQADMEANLAQDDDEDRETDDDDQHVANAPTSSETFLPKVDPSSLPAELRMDEYSDDEDNEAVQGSALGNMLVGTTEMDYEGMQDDDHGSEEDDGDDGDDVRTESAVAGAESNDVDSSDDEGDDDLGDVPDTREFMPIDVEGLEAMGLSAVGISGEMNLEDDEVDNDEDSDADDINLSPDDAILVVAKTEEVSSTNSSLTLSTACYCEAHRKTYTDSFSFIAVL